MWLDRTEIPYSFACVDLLTFALFILSFPLLFVREAPSFALVLKLMRIFLGGCLFVISVFLFVISFFFLLCFPLSLRLPCLLSLSFSSLVLGSQPNLFAEGGHDSRVDCGVGRSGACSSLGRAHSQQAGALQRSIPLDRQRRVQRRHAGRRHAVTRRDERRRKKERKKENKMGGG